MGLFTVRIEKKTYKSLRDFELKIREKINQVMEVLESNPWPAKEYNMTKIEGLEYCYRIRIGRYRICYKVDSESKLVYVYLIERKSETTYK